MISSPAKAAYLVSGTTWISFDLPQTIYMKILAARQLGLGGLMVRRRAVAAGAARADAAAWPAAERQAPASLVLCQPALRPAAMLASCQGFA